jgi:DNA-binding transcriptional MerR regulator
MKTYSISNLEIYSGIRAHTLRAWEKRYGLFSPQRSPGNFRYYDIVDLAHLLKLCLLSKSGFRISELSVMDIQTLDDHLDHLVEKKEIQVREINKLVLSMLAPDPEDFELILKNAVGTWGIEETITAIILPFIERVRIFSCRNCNYELDFVVTALRQKLIFGIEQTGPVKQQDKIVLFFLPEGEHYDLFLLYIKFLAKSSGMRTLYLGTNISQEKVKAVIARKQPDFLVTYISPKQKFKLDEITAHLNELECPPGFLITHHQSQPGHAKDPRFVSYADVMSRLP